MRVHVDDPHAAAADDDLPARHGATRRRRLAATEGRAAEGAEASAGTGDAPHELSAIWFHGTRHRAAASKTTRPPTIVSTGVMFLISSAGTVR